MLICHFYRSQTTGWHVLVLLKLALVVDWQFLKRNPGQQHAIVVRASHERISLYSFLGTLQQLYI